MKKRVVLTQMAVDAILDDNDLVERIKLSDKNKERLRETRSVRGIRMSSLSEICNTLDIEPGSVFELAESGETPEENENVINKAKRTSIFGSLRITTRQKK